ncbi:hypothetical protein G4Z16_00875 [Streptomyces bathyalis]|uniref:Uncharacterized protein n=1 Tax=Streptomyces bathyalis TaxID=2710756 RepID=A0A7T1T2I0_9ACTN|nr:hypothetical protein [Streptomyces bathyalis]QPP05180.1 hypothetical protein G4Z16_00875 [Streptomyces bathyalis]
MDPPHFHFGFHAEYDFVAKATTNISPHLAEWYLTREQFQQLPGTPGLYRLRVPEQDGRRRAQQAVKDLRAHGFTVHTDLALDPAARQPVMLTERRNRRAEASSVRSPQQSPALTFTRPASEAASFARPPLRAPARPGTSPSRRRS